MVSAPFVGYLDTGIVPDFHEGAELYFVTQRRKDYFPSALFQQMPHWTSREWNKLALDYYIQGEAAANYYMQG